MSTDPPTSFTCGRCGRTSHNPNDVRYRYCGACHAFEDEPSPAFPQITGRCPACGRASLFLGAGGHVTCAQHDCPNPGLVDELLALENHQHTVVFDDAAERFHTTHSIACRVAGVDACPIDHELTQLTGRPMPPGRYRAEISDGHLQLVPVRHGS